MHASLERKVAGIGLAILGATAAYFTAFKLLMWNSVVVHTEESSIHRVFFDQVTLRFPQESHSLVDFLTANFLMLGGAAALVVSFWLGERLYYGLATRPDDARYMRRFFGLAGIGLVWLALDELFLIHEFASANLYVPDHQILMLYALAGGTICVFFYRALLASYLALGLLAGGVLFHAAALGMDFMHGAGWLPEEPFEMLAAGMYAIAMAAYAARIMSPSAAEKPRSVPPVEPFSTEVVQVDEPTGEERTPVDGFPSDPTWVK